MLSGCQTSHINLRWFDDMEISEGTMGHNNNSLKAHAVRVQALAVFRVQENKSGLPTA